LLRRELNRVFGADADQDRPSWARARLSEPGMLDEYLLLRGVDERGFPRDEVLRRLGTPEVLDVDARLQGFRAPDRAATQRSPAREARAPGRVSLRSSGTLGQLLRGERELELDLPTTLEDVLKQAALDDASLRSQLFAGERLIPAVWRSGQRLAREDRIESGDVLDLVTAISGG